MWTAWTSGVHWGERTRWAPVEIFRQNVFAQNKRDSVVSRLSRKLRQAVIAVTPRVSPNCLCSSNSHSHQRLCCELAGCEQNVQETVKNREKQSLCQLFCQFHRIPIEWQWEHSQKLSFLSLGESARRRRWSFWLPRVVSSSTLFKDFHPGNILLKSILNSTHTFAVRKIAKKQQLAFAWMKGRVYIM